jgi:hypothetical protein
LAAGEEFENGKTIALSSKALAAGEECFIEIMSLITLQKNNPEHELLFVFFVIKVGVQHKAGPPIAEKLLI